MASVMARRRRSSRGELLAAAWEVAAYFRAYSAYGSERKACQALERRRPGFSPRRYRNAFLKGVALYDAAVALVDRHADALGRETDAEAGRYPDFRDLVGRLRRRYPGFRVPTYRAALVWVFVRHYLR